MKKKSGLRRKRKSSARIKQILSRPTSQARLPTGKTVTEFLTEHGLARGIQLDTPTTKTTDGKLFVQGGQRYELGRILARGGMGVVYEARDLNCLRTVAIKVLPKDVILPQEDLLRFVEEAQINSQLEHPNIVPIHEMGLDEQGRVFYAMKYVKGRTLTEILIALRQGHPQTVEQFPLARLLNIFQKACDAVAFAHSKGVVHRDLKPDNIMVGEYGEVVVMDWGLATLVAGIPPLPAAGRGAVPAPVATGGEVLESQRKAASSAVYLSRAKTEFQVTSRRVIGTPGFMAPEQLRTGDACADFRADIYSLGATLYSILTLRAPLAGKNLKQTLRKILVGEIVPPTAFNKTGVVGPEKPEEGHVGLVHCPDGKIPSMLSDIAMKALRTEPGDRYTTVIELQREIEAFQDGLIWHLVIDQDFSGPNPLAQWEVVGCRHEIRDGELRLSHGEPQMLLFKVDVPGDVRIEFECRQESVYLNTIGCFFSAVRSESRKDVPLTGYKFEYGAFDNSLNVLVRSGRQMVSRPESPLARGKVYRMRAERIGARLKLVVNDQEVFSEVDHDPLTGADRTAVGVVGWLADTVISRIRIYSLGTPWKSDILDIAERQTQKGNYALAQALLQEAMESFPDATRMERARRARDRARQREEMARDLAMWRDRLRTAWPHAEFSIGLNNEGLSLEIPPCGIKDLEPLKGMPITSLSMAYNQIASLEPLRGMRLAMLNCMGNPITKLDPLRGMPLSVLVCEGCPLSSLEPLKDMPLNLLNFGGARVSSLAPLRGMSLTFLCCYGNQLTDLKPLKGMKSLAALYCNGNRIETLEPLRGIPIVTINCSGNSLTSLEPLRGMPLSVLHCGDNRIESVEPVSRAPLKMFSLQNNRIDSLDSLQGMPLAALICGNNPLTNISTFLNNPPDDFRFDTDTLATQELEWARMVWSRDFRFAGHARNVDVLLALRRNDLKKLRKLAVRHRGHGYLFVPKFMTWEEAKACCEQLGGHLVSITNREENDFLNSLFPFGSWFWIGLHRTERDHEWITGEPFAYSNFLDLLQDHKMGPKIFSGRWTADDTPTAHNSFMVEWED